MGPAVLAVLLLFNSAAGNRSRARATDAVRRRWSEDEVVVLDEAEPAVRRVRLDQAVVSGVRAVVVHGGDGSLSEAVNVLRGRNVVLGLVPRGSGNDFARGAGLDRGRGPSAVLDLVGAALDWTRSEQDLPEGQEHRTPAGQGRHAVGRAEGAEGPRVRPMDAVRLRVRTGTQGADGPSRELLAVNSVNIGIDAEVNARALASRRVPPRWKYLVALCRVVLDVRPARIWVSHEGVPPAAGPGSCSRS